MVAFWEGSRPPFTSAIYFRRLLPQSTSAVCIYGDYRASSLDPFSPVVIEMDVQSDAELAAEVDAFVFGTEILSTT